MASASSSGRAAACGASQRPAVAAAVEGPALPPADLWKRVEEVYERAQETGAAFKTETRTEVFRDPGPPAMDFVLRIAAALKAKPKGASEAQQQQKAQQPPQKQQGQQQQGQPQQQPQGQQQPGPKPPAFNPFLPYEEALWVAHLSPTHTLLLNKFNVVAKHVLVVTRAFESQADPLNTRDLGATMEVLRAMPDGGVAFYNCGQHSGRSQPHKHLQVVPLPFADGLAPRPPVAAIVDAACAAAAPLEVVPLRALPFRAYAARFDDGASPEQLGALASQLLNACGEGLPRPVSYNVLIWPGAMFLAPRRAECAGPVAINSLGFAGTMLLRSEEDMAYAKAAGPMSMLAAVGVPWAAAAAAPPPGGG